MTTRAGANPRSMALRRILRVLATFRIVLVVAGVLLALDGLCALELSILGPQDGPVLYFLLGLLFGGFLGAVWYLAAVMSGGANALIGASAEKWTERELVALGPDWELVHGVTFAVGHRGARLDVDHVAIGPGGVLVVETKWSSSPLELGTARRDWRVRYAARQADGNAGRVRALLLRDAPDLPVEALVVLWGPVDVAKEAIVQAGSVGVVAGDDGDRWRPALLSQLPRITQQARAVALAKLKNYVAATPERARS